MINLPIIEVKKWKPILNLTKKDLDQAGDFEFEKGS